MRSPTVLLLAVLLLTSGCVTDFTDSQTDTDNEEPLGITTPSPSSPSASDLQGTYVGLYEQAMPSVVSVEVFAGGDRPFRLSGGTGFVYDGEGHIVTNQHVVDGGDEYEVTFQDGVSVSAEVVGTSVYNDLAVLRIDPGEHELEPLTLGDSSKLDEGMFVVAMGSPLGLAGSMTHGIVSALDRTMPVQGFQIPAIVQTDAPINPGNSGGPLLNLDGDVVGVNRAKAEAENIGFAVSSNLVKRVVPVLVEEGEYRDPWIGIRYVPVNPGVAEEMGLEAARGVEVAQVVPNSPADNAGLRGATDEITVHGTPFPVGGDVIIGIDGEEVRTGDDLLSFLALHTSVDETVEFRIVRDGKEITVDLTLGQRPPP